jgi:hypothetical protein
MLSVGPAARPLMEGWAEKVAAVTEAAKTSHRAPVFVHGVHEAHDAEEGRDAEEGGGGGGERVRIARRLATWEAQSVATWWRGACRSEEDEAAVRSPGDHCAVQPSGPRRLRVCPRQLA